MQAFDLKVKLYADGAVEADILSIMAKYPVSGFTTNPSLIRKAGVTDYETHCKSLLKISGDKPISFEVLSDDIQDMRDQALKLASWGKNVFCKIPVTNSRGESCAGIVSDLTDRGVKVNVTAIFTLKQIEEFYLAIGPGVSCNLSIFAGRIADTGKDAAQLVAEAVDMVKSNKDIEMIWASPRHVYNVVEAAKTGCHIITATTDIFNKLHLLGYDNTQYSLDTVKMFLEDAKAAKFAL